MSKSQSLIIFVIVLPLFLAGMFGLGKFIQMKHGATIAGPEIVSPTPFSTGSDTLKGPTALLTKESGEVEFKLSTDQEFKKLETNEVSVPTDTTVKTGANSLAHVVFPDNSLMSLSKDTEVVLHFEDKKIKIIQLLGNTWHRVEKVLEGNEYSVETSNTLATVRGTEFNVGILPDNGSEVYVMESVVDVSKLKKVGDEMKVQETEKVTKDKHIFMKLADADVPMKVVDLPEDKKKSDWFKRNTKLTEEIKKAEAAEEEKAGLDAVTGTPATGADKEKKDLIKSAVRKEMMESIQTNVELKKIDALFPTPTDTPAGSDKTKKLNEVPVGKVKGISTAVTVENTPAVSATEKPQTPEADTRNVQKIVKPVVAPVEDPKIACQKDKENKLMPLKATLETQQKELSALQAVSSNVATRTSPLEAGIVKKDAVVNPKITALESDIRATKNEIANVERALPCN